MSTPVIIEAAINGATTKDVNPHVPIEPAEIAADALAAFEAGASIVHAHSGGLRGGDGAAVAQRYLEAFEPVWQQRPGALIYPTVNYGRDGVDMEHLIIMRRHGLRLGPLDPGSINLGGVDEAGVPVGRFVYKNSFASLVTNIAAHAEH